MQRRYVLSILASLPIAGCSRVSGSSAGSGSGSLNPFGRGRRTRQVNPADREPLVDPSRIGDPAELRPLIAQVETMQVNRTPGGAIVTATGIAEGGGFYDAKLVRVGIENGVLAYDFRAQSPEVPVAAPTVQTRRITVAVTLTDNDLADVRAIAVRGALNAISAAR